MALATSTIIAGIGLAVGIAGAGVSAYSTMEQANASQDAEKSRKRQMNFEAQRRRRQIIRDMIIARAQGRANAAVQGVSGGDSAVLGGQAQAANTAAAETQAVNVGQQNSSDIFSANRRMASAQAVGAWGGAAQNIGGQIVNNSKTISRVGSSYGLWGPEA